MKPPVRVECGECLSSVEWDPSTVAPALCPHCGATLDSRMSQAETPTHEYTRPLPLGLPPGETPALWAETWNKGSLGTIGRFQLRELLGDGGFGQVFQAYDPRLDRDVALKVLKQPSPGERVMERFFREARAAARLKHPNIVAVYDAGRDAGRCWVAYELVRGRTLNRLRDLQTMTFETAVRIVRDLADALDHAHSEGVFHRDLKPSNVIIDDDGQPHLTDFGLSKRADLESELTHDGAILGTPAYMSPEQAGGQSHLADERSDVYSLGVMLYELLLGRRPVDLPSGAPAWRARAAETATPPRSINRDVPIALDRVCVRALATEPAERYPDARSFVRDLDEWLHCRQLRAKTRRRAVAATLCAALIVCGLIGAQPRMRGRVAHLFERPQPVPVANPILPAAPVIPPNHVPNPVQHTALKPPVETGLLGNRESKKYHRPGCAHVSTILDRNLIRFQDEAEAREKHFMRCLTCLGPRSSGDGSGTTADAAPSGHAP